MLTGDLNGYNMYPVQIMSSPDYYLKAVSLEPLLEMSRTS